MYVVQIQRSDEKQSQGWWRECVCMYMCVFVWTILGNSSAIRGPFLLYFDSQQPVAIVVVLFFQDVCRERGCTSSRTGIVWLEPLFYTTHNSMPGIFFLTLTRYKHPYRTGIPELSLTSTGCVTSINEFVRNNPFTVCAGYFISRTQGTQGLYKTSNFTYSQCEAIVFPDSLCSPSC